MKKFELEIEQDTSPESPREWDNVTTMLCFHREYTLGDENPYTKDEFDSWDEMEQRIKEDYKRYMIKPLYLYDHSGLTISTTPFPDHYYRVRDSMQIGFVFIEEKKWKMCMGDTEVTEERMEEIIKGEVEIYDQYLRGDVWGYRIVEVETCDMGHEHRNVVESCWGYYGDDAESEGKEALEGYLKELV